MFGVVQAVTDAIRNSDAELNSTSGTDLLGCTSLPSDRRRLLSLRITPMAAVVDFTWQDDHECAALGLYSADRMSNIVLSH